MQDNNALTENGLSSYPFILSEKLESLYKIRASEIKFGLDTEQAILGHMHNPERSWPSIHVAGTNGKGSVCAMLESVLRSAGLKTGLFTSPHLIRFNERIRVEGKCISDEELAELIDCVENAARLTSSEESQRPSTFFELSTAIGFEHFKRKQVNIAVIETGMGGRLDATNVISPLISIITSISLEHQHWLGMDINSIAHEKCGIIKPGRPIIIGRLPDEARDIAKKIADERKARLVEAEKIISVQLVDRSLSGMKIKIESSTASYGTVTIPLLGSKTLENTAVTVAALETLADIVRWNVQPCTLKSGLEQVCWPGRFHLISRHPPTIVDGAHNPEAAETLARSLRELFRNPKIGLILGMSGDKDIAGFLRPFHDLVKQFWAVPIKSERSLSTSIIADHARALGWQATETDTIAAIEQAKDWALKTGGIVCVAGSLFLAGEALESQYGNDIF